MRAGDLVKLMSDRKVSESAKDFELLDIEDKVQAELRRCAKKETKLSDDRKRQIISNYVMDHAEQWRIPGYITENNELNTTRLIETISDDLLNYGILEKPINDESIDEIRINGRWVIVCYSDGTNEFLKDEDGNILYFKTPDEQKTIIGRMIEGDDTVFNMTDRLANGRTWEQYRISITDGSSISRSSIEEENGSLTDESKRYATATIRKFRSEKLTLSQIVGFKGLSDDMARLLDFIISKTSFVTVGPTFSGKTTLNRALLEHIDPWMRVICIQSPTEIDLREFDDKGFPLNDRVMWEAKDGAADTDKNGKHLPHVASIRNLIEHTLRNSPHIISINEIRRQEEFFNLLDVGQAGHIINTTFHSASPAEAVRRFTNQIVAETGQAYETALQNVAEVVRFVICQKRLGDGSRKITDIAEICGVDPKYPRQPIINPIYQYRVEETIKDENGRIKKNGIIGFHQKIGNLSPELRRNLGYEGVSKEDLKIIDPEVTPCTIEDDNEYVSDMCTYTGDFKTVDDALKEKLKRIENGTVKMKKKKVAPKKKKEEKEEKEEEE